MSRIKSPYDRQNTHLKSKLGENALAPKVFISSAVLHLMVIWALVTFSQAPSLPKLPSVGEVITFQFESGGEPVGIDSNSKEASANLDTATVPPQNNQKDNQENTEQRNITTTSVFPQEDIISIETTQKQLTELVKSSTPPPPVVKDVIKPKPPKVKPNSESDEKKLAAALAGIGKILEDRQVNPVS